MFIHREKFQKLFDASGKGDEKAKAILDAFMNDGECCSAMIDEYFKPVEPEVKAGEPSPSASPEVEVKGADRSEMSGLEKFLSDNGVKEGDDDYEEFVDSYYQMFPGQKPEEKPAELEQPAVEPQPEVEPVSTNLDDFVKEETEGIGKYDKLIIEFTTMPGISEAIRSGIVGKIQKIKEDELAHIAVLRDIAETLKKKGE